MKYSREEVYNKFNGRCAYSGTILEPDWQVDHLYPKRRAHFLLCDYMRKLENIDINDIDDIKNLMPCQRYINNYKGGLGIESFRSDRSFGLMTLHKRIAKLPKNPRTEKSIKHKRNLLKLSEYFGITIDKPFSGVFYFERKGVINGKNKN